MLTVTFGVFTMSRIKIPLWCNRFMEGREDANDDAHPGRESTPATDETTEAMKKMILNNRRITITEVVDNFGISFGSCQAIFTDVIGMKHGSEDCFKIVKL